MTHPTLPFLLSGSAPVTRQAAVRGGSSGETLPSHSEQGLH